MSSESPAGGEEDGEAESTASSVKNTVDYETLDSSAVTERVKVDDFGEDQFKQEVGDANGTAV